MRGTLGSGYWEARKGINMTTRLITTGMAALFAAAAVLSPIAVSAAPSPNAASSTNAIQKIAANAAKAELVRSDSLSFGEGAVRLSGTNRYATSAAVGRSWPAGKQTAFIASGETFPDALSAASRAGAEGAPLLLTRSASLPNETAAELTRLRPERIVIVGGSDKVSAAVADQLVGYATSGQVVRIGGNDHYATSVAVSRLYPAKVTTAYLASGEDFPDALAGAALASHQGAPLLLTPKAGLTPSARAELLRLAPQQIIVLGGPAAVSDTALQAAAPLSVSPIRRIAGTNRYLTAAAAAAEFEPGSSTTYVASGQNFPDALVGAAASARDGAPLLLTRKDQVDPASAQALDTQRPQAMYALGGTAVISSSTMESLGKYLVAPGTPDAKGTVIWQDKFDTAPDGPLNTQAKGNAIFAPTAAQTTNTTYANGSIVNDAPNGKVLRHNIPGGELGKFIVSPVPTVLTDHAILEYETRFDANFDWRWGGKMGPGLVGWKPGYGPYDPTSGQGNRDIGFSTRLMWHGRGDDGSRPFQGTLGKIPSGNVNDIVTYIYARYPQDGFSGYGWHSSLGEMLPDAWHKISMEVKLNTVGSSDGVFKVHVDNKLVFSASNWNYRNTKDIRIQAILWDVHRGGGLTKNWVSPKRSYIDERNVTLRNLKP